MRKGMPLLMALAVCASCFAQEGTFSPDAGDMTIRAQTCADAHEPPEERMRACTVLIKEAGLVGRDLANMYLYRARAARSAQEDESAARDLDLAIKADDRYAVAYFERGNFRAGNGEKKQALQDYDRAIRLKRSQPEFFINRGNTHKDLGDADAAIDDYSRAIELDPKIAVAWFNRSLAYAQLGQRELAARDRSRALELDPKLAKPPLR